MSLGTVCLADRGSDARQDAGNPGPGLFSGSILTALGQTEFPWLFPRASFEGANSRIPSSPSPGATKFGATFLKGCLRRAKSQWIKGTAAFLSAQKKKTS